MLRGIQRCVAADREFGDESIEISALDEPVLGNLGDSLPTPNWLDTTPRVTKDVDLVLGLDLIKDASHQKSVVSALTQNGFEASDRESEQRWKFLKRLSGDQLIVVIYARDMGSFMHAGAS